MAATVKVIDLTGKWLKFYELARLTEGEIIPLVQRTLGELLA